MKLHLLILSLLLTIASSSAQTNVTWNLGGNGDWSVGSNWSGGIAPINGQPNAGNTYNAILDTNRVITLDVPVAITGFTQSSGTITGSKDLTIHGPASWTIGTMSGSGTTRVATGANLVMGWSSDWKFLSRTLENLGTTTWTSALNHLASIEGTGGHFINRTGGVFNSEADSEFKQAFTNEGTFTRSGAGASTFSGNFANGPTGTVAVNGGNLILRGGGSGSGSFNLASGTQLQFNAGTYTAQDKTQVGGAGTMIVAETATFTAGAAAQDVISVERLAFNQGTINGSGELRIGNSASWVMGAMGGTGTTVVAENGTLTMNSTFGWKNLGRTFRNFGSTTWSAAPWGDLHTVTVDTGGHFINESSGTFNSEATSVNHTFNPPFTNHGLLVRSGAGTSTFSGVFANQGIVEVNSGALQLSGGGTHTGTFHVVAGSSLVLAGGTHGFNAGSYNIAGTTTISGGTANFSVAAETGNLTVNGGTLTANEGLNVKNNLTFSSGTINGSGAVTLRGGNSVWTTGTMGGAGTTSVAEGAELTMNASTSSWKNLGRTFRNFGSTTWSAAPWGDLHTVTVDTGGHFINESSGTFNSEATELNHIFNPPFTNHGAFVRSGAGTSIFSGVFSNSGTIEVKQGTLRLTGGGTLGGTLSVAAGSSVGIHGNGVRVYTAAADLTVTGDATGGEVQLGAVAGETDLTLSVGTEPGNEVAFPRISLRDGKLSGPGILKLTGTADWVQTVIQASSRVMVEEGAKLRILAHGGAGKTLAGTLTNRGEVVWEVNGEEWRRNVAGSGNFVNRPGAVFRAETPGTIAPGFSNEGLFVRSGAGTSTFSGLFTNTGNIEVEQGTLSLTGGGTLGGTLSVAAGSSVEIHGSGGRVYTAAADLTVTGDATGGAVQLGAVAGATDLTLSVGKENQHEVAVAFPRISLRDGKLSGPGILKLTGTADWVQTVIQASSRVMVEEGAKLRILAHGGAGKTLAGTLTNRGEVVWEVNGEEWRRNVAGSGNFVNRPGAIFRAETPGAIAPGFSNEGLFIRSGAGTSTFSGVFTNTGTVEVKSGMLTLSNGGSNPGASISGTWLVGNPESPTTPAVLDFPSGSSITSIASGGVVHLIGTGASISGTGSLHTNDGTLRLLAGSGMTRTTHPNTTFTNNGQLRLESLEGGAFDITTFSNTGTISGFGSIPKIVNNSGTIRSDAGNLSLGGGTSGSAGILEVLGDSTLSIGAASSTGMLAIEGGLLDLGNSTLTVHTDYTNTAFGSGNDFDPRANVSGTGEIHAGGHVVQQLTGDGVVGGDTATPFLTLTSRLGVPLEGVLHVTNSGTDGPVLRGALLGGGGDGWSIEAGDFGPLDSGESKPVPFSLSGESVGPVNALPIQVINNFDNVPNQTLTINGTVYRPGEGSLAQGIWFGNVRVGAGSVLPIAVSNSAPADGYSENINIRVVDGSATGTAWLPVNGQGITGLAPGQSNDDLNVGFGPQGPGPQIGSIAVEIETAGIPGTTLTAELLETRTVDVTGIGWLPAVPAILAPTEPIRVRQNTEVWVPVPVGNTAAETPYTERLIGIASPTGSIAITGVLNSVNLLPAQETDSSVLWRLDTSNTNTSILPQRAVGRYRFSTSGEGTSGIADAFLGEQQFEIPFLVYQRAQPIFEYDYGSRPIARIGESPLRHLEIGNGGNPLHTESLSVRFGGATGHVLHNGEEIVRLPANQTSLAMAVGVNTTHPGIRSGSVILDWYTDGAGTSGQPEEKISSFPLNVEWQVNHQAQASITREDGLSSLPEIEPGRYLLDLGDVSPLSHSPSAYVRIANSLMGPFEYQDILMMELLPGGGQPSPFVVSTIQGTNPILPGGHLLMRFDLQEASLGPHEQTFRVHLSSGNTSSVILIEDIEIVLRAHVVDPLDLSQMEADDAVFAMAEAHLDGERSWVIGGDFTTLGGQPRQRLARLLGDRTLDPVFMPQVTGGSVLCVTIDNQGRILIGGSFTHVNGIARNRMARLSTDGTLDEDFDPDFNDTVRVILVTHANDIYVAGRFTSVGGPGQTGPFSRIVRLDSQGLWDPSFRIEPNAEVYAMALEPDGSLLLAGEFTKLQPGGAFQPEFERNRVARLVAGSGGFVSETVDPDFHPNVNGWVSNLVVQPDGRILLGGDFTEIGGNLRHRLGRIFKNGNVDLGGFGSATAINNGNVDTMALASNGHIFVGGTFTLAGGSVRDRLLQLGPSGFMASQFDPSPDHSVLGLLLDTAPEESGAHLLFGGRFSLPAGRMARWSGFSGRDQVVPTGSEGGTIHWIREGFAPAFVSATIEIWDGNEWGAPTAGVRQSTPTGMIWNFGGIAPNSKVRLSGRTTGGFHSASSGLDQRIIDLSLRNYAAWASLNIPPEQDASPSANPARDGITNLLKYASNLDPTRPDVRRIEPEIIEPESQAALAGLPLDRMVGGRLRIYFLKPVEPSGLSVTALFTDDLSSPAEAWMPQPASVFVREDSVSGYRLYYADDPAEDPSPRRFGTIRVHQIETP